MIFPMQIDPMVALKRLPPTLLGRIAAPLDEDGCWGWVDWILARGYGGIAIGPRKKRYAHQVVYELTVGPVPLGLELDHLCRNHGCVNPNHLEPVTHRVNVLRGEGNAAKNSQKTHCPKGHPLSGENLHPWYLARGHRYCLTCSRAAARKAQAKVRMRAKMESEA